MKKRNICNELKCFDLFYKREDMKDGHLNQCKECYKKKVGENRNKKLEQYMENERVRSRAYYKKNKERVKERVKEYFKTDSGKLAQLKAKANFIKNNREKYKAHRDVEYAVSRGKLVKPNICEICKNVNGIIHGHHEDYKKTLDVIWCCPQCHKDLHKNNVALNE